MIVELNMMMVMMLNMNTMMMLVMLMSDAADDSHDHRLHRLMVVVETTTMTLPSHTYFHHSKIASHCISETSHRT